MLRFFSVKNCRQFREELVFDFTNTRDYQFNSNCVKNGLVNKAIIYGKNAVGKTSLMEAMQDIYFTTLGRAEVNSDSPYPYRNADSDDDETIQFHYTFLLDGVIVDYQYEKTDFSHVVSEKLSFDDTVVFEYSRKKGFYYFDHVDVIGAEQLKWASFQNMSIDGADTELMGTLTALRFAYSNTAADEGSLLKKMIAFITRMRFTISSSTPMHYLFMKLNELANSGTDAVRKFEAFLNDFGVTCKLTVLKEADGKKNLYFDYKTPLAFLENMSSGTKLLTKFYLQFVLSKPRPSFIFVDEFDAYYHFELSEKIVKLLEEEFDCQVVLTTHNTNLLSNSIMRPDCFLILHDGKLTPICDATTRELRQGHNLEKLYMSGEFDAE
ncbi:MAG: ATP-binding protein [Oscillospiraceae bacterium]|nr:ATP-binding protein [Oscillospiraceae bacterium]